MHTTLGAIIFVAAIFMVIVLWPFAFGNLPSVHTRLTVSTAATCMSPETAALKFGMTPCIETKIKK